MVALAPFIFKPSPVTSRRPKEMVTLSMSQLCKFIAKENAVSCEALMAAMKLVADGVALAIARGYRVQWRGLLSIEIREMPARKRFHRIKKVMYDQPAFCRVHIKNADSLNNRVRELAKAEVERAVRQLPLSYPGQK